MDEGHADRYAVIRPPGPGLDVPGTPAADAPPRGDDKPSVPFRMLMQKNITVHAILVYTMPEPAKTAAMTDITRALQEGGPRPLITSRMPLERIAEAHAHVEQVASIGNTVLQVA